MPPGSSERYLRTMPLGSGMMLIEASAVCRAKAGIGSVSVSPASGCR